MPEKSASRTSVRESKGDATFPSPVCSPFLALANFSFNPFLTKEPVHRQPNICIIICNGTTNCPISVIISRTVKLDEAVMVFQTKLCKISFCHVLHNCRNSDYFTRVFRFTLNVSVIKIVFNNGQITYQSQGGFPNIRNKRFGRFFPNVRSFFSLFGRAEHGVEGKNWGNPPPALHFLPSPNFRLTEQEKLLFKRMIKTHGNACHAD